MKVEKLQAEISRKLGVDITLTERFITSTQTEYILTYNGKFNKISIMEDMVSEEKDSPFSKYSVLLIEAKRLLK